MKGATDACARAQARAIWGWDPDELLGAGKQPIQELERCQPVPVDPSCDDRNLTPPPVETVPDPLQRGPAKGWLPPNFPFGQ